VPNLTVQNANPANLAGFVIVSDDRDGDNILAKKVGSVIYSDNDLVNVMFLKGGEAIAFQQGSQSTNNGIWEIVPSTTTDIFYDKGKVGIGTAAIPHGGIGWAMLALDGSFEDESGPHIQITTDEDDYPLLQVLSFSHDDIFISFDAYWNGSWRSSDAGSNYQIRKASDRFSIMYESNVSVSGAVPWNTGITLNINGDVGIGTTGPDARLDVLDTGGAQLRLTFEDGVKFADLTLDTNHDLTITPSSTGQVILQPTTDSTDFFQVLDADGGLPILNVDSTNERVGIGPVAPPEVDFHLSRDGSGTSFITEKYGGAPDMIARRANGTLAVPSAIGANVQLFGFGVRPWFNDTSAFSAGSIGNFTFNSDEAISSTTKGTRFTVGTTENGNNSVTERMRINNAGDMGIGATTINAQLHVDQASTTAAQPVLLLDQADISEEMIEFATTIGVGNAIEAVGAKTLTTTHFIKVTLPGALTRYIPVGTIA
jgi:hypothetical protein